MAPTYKTLADAPDTFRGLLDSARDPRRARARKGREGRRLPHGDEVADLPAMQTRSNARAPDPIARALRAAYLA
jgi:hypothetical protein